MDAPLWKLLDVDDDGQVWIARAAGDNFQMECLGPYEPVAAMIAAWLAKASVFPQNVDQAVVENDVVA